MSLVSSHQNSEQQGALPGTPPYFLIKNCINHEASFAQLRYRQLVRKKKNLFPYEVFIWIAQSQLPAVLVGKEKTLLLDYDHCQHSRYIHTPGPGYTLADRKQQLKQYFKETLPNSDYDHRVAQMAPLYSVGMTIDLRLNVYTLKLDGRVELDPGTRNNISEFEEGWMNDLSPLDRATVEFLQETVAFNRRQKRKRTR